MRLALMGVVTVAAALAAGVQSGRAQESFFNERFCARGGDTKIPDCSFYSTQESVFLFAKPSGKSAYFLCPAAQ